MNKIIIYLFLGFVPTFLYAQSKVTVLDESTKNPYIQQRYILLH
ncbi:MAG TPA: hypothetical protein PKV40_02950 [Candidatus Kapabacteria bacterium]|nr:hypothetical protein [Candidatus Kapabacteria bacterium]HRT68087.1 hypothetical protein [Bacteroidota bacterium]